MTLRGSLNIQHPTFNLQRPATLFPAIALITLLGACSHSPAPSTLPSPDAVDGEAALQEVARFVAIGPRVSGTPGASSAAAYISERLRGTGYRPLLDAFPDATPGADVVFANVIGVPPGLDGDTLSEILAGSATPAVILLSHYDTKAGISDHFVGANDSGSSTGLLLYLADLLAERGSTSPPIILAFVDGEEALHDYGPQDGLHGSRHMAEQIIDADLQNKVRAVIVLDMIGDSDLSIRIPRNVTRDLLSVAFDAAQNEGVRSQFGISGGAILDDHVPFLERGIPAIDLIDFEFGSAPGLNDYWHTDADTMDKLSAESLETVGRVVLGMLQRLAGTARPTQP
ncbi:MAG: M28 family peptidase [Kiritimatiellia bacterium]|jgi:glutaminyl-peptide cyclotransferase|nr:M28 family peptidase [Kiritimatiellia bacterium]MDP6630931.1 M28 family peptidase [Kiritimatiellia bacterium]MDP6810320.1 M28 family peptidase [Kiritimatiellia bacterium]MDP7022691.1 M28 family peptidase [Kiritimatiellia bacterium]